jgi:hypothetical protein
MRKRGASLSLPPAYDPSLSLPPAYDPQGSANAEPDRSSRVAEFERGVQVTPAARTKARVGRPLRLDS